MNMIRQIFDPVTRHYFDFKGRTGRRTFWMFVLITVVLYVVVLRISEQGATVLMYALAIPTAAIMVRRLHDIGKTGWLAALIVIPYPLYLVAVLPLAWVLGSEGASGLAMFIALGVVVLYPVILIVLFYWCIQPSKPDVSASELISQPATNTQNQTAPPPSGV